MKKLMLSGLLIISLLMGLTADALAATITVQAAVPTFRVTLNGVLVDNSYRRYPLLVYKGITYFPMTFDDCRFLGLSTDWSATDGLSIDKTDGSIYGWEETVNKVRNNRSYQARIVQYPIKLNGTSINNQEEPYPLLSFRDITYFPLTWRFAVDQFGWDYDFNADKGLTIASCALPPNDGSHHQGSTITHSFNDVTIHVKYSGWGPWANNLTIERNGTIEPLGDPQYAYGYTVKESEWQNNGEILFLDGWLYTTAAIPFKSTTSTPCKINIQTNETILLK